ncbi:hypothetical protein B0H13DRAFT_2362929 [Mycena leptocephala]|nr:hypothetical protein B0H13DRAFT_2362929 [Mycena leptocephala]
MAEMVAGPILLTGAIGTRDAPREAFIAGEHVRLLDASTYSIPFEVGATIDPIYLMNPRILDMLPPTMKPFIDFAVRKVKRSILMSAGLIELAGGPGIGLVRQYLAFPSIECCVLRPSFFFGASSAGPGFILVTLIVRQIIYFGFIPTPYRASDEIVAATADKLIVHISTEDIT